MNGDKVKKAVNTKVIPKPEKKYDPSKNLGKYLYKPSKGMTGTRG